MTSTGAASVAVWITMVAACARATPPPTPALPPPAAPPAAQPAPAEETVRGRLVFVGDFEEPGEFEPGRTYPQFSANVHSCEFEARCETDSLAMVEAPVRAGRRAVRMTLRSTDRQRTSGVRVELQTTRKYEQALEEDYWYGFSIHVPEDWVFDERDQKVVHQWHTCCGNPGGNPILGLRIIGSRWVVTREMREGAIVTLFTAGVERGRWTDWVWRVRWSPGETGVFEAWKDGRPVHAERGPNMAPGTRTGGHYQKFGMYGLFRPDAATQERTLYYDEIRVARGPGDLRDLVAPGGRAALVNGPRSGLD